MQQLMVVLMTMLAAIPVSWGGAATVDAEIEHLLNYVRTSQMMFVRNGSEYKPAEAADHMAKKRNHFKNRITTAEDFIRLAATKSLVSGETYLIRSSDGKTEKTAEWLSRDLERFRNKKNQACNQRIKAAPLIIDYLCSNSIFCGLLQVWL